MKRYIKSNSSSSIGYEYPIEINSSFPDIDENYIEQQIRQILEPAENYVAKVQVNLGVLSINDIRVYSNQKVPQLRVTCPTKNIQRNIDNLLRYLRNNINDWTKKNDDRARASSLGTPLTAMSVVSRLLKKQFGLKPTFTYTDTGTLEYMLIDLPFTHDREPNVSEGEALSDEVDTYLSEIKDKYDLNMTWILPVGNSIWYTPWTIRVSRYNPYFSYNSKTKEYTRV